MSFNPHPPLSGFPITLLTSLVIGEIVYRLLRRDFSAVRLFMVLIIGATLGATYFSGYWGIDAAKAVSGHLSPELIDEHQSAAKALLFFSPLFLLFGLLRAGPYRDRTAVIGVYYLALIAMWCGAAKVSFLGGELVFKHGAAVEPQALTSQSVHE